MDNFIPWTGTLKAIKEVTPLIVYVTIEFTKEGSPELTFENEYKLVAEHFQSLEAYQAELQRQLDKLNNFQITIEQLKQLVSETNV